MDNSQVFTSILLPAAISAAVVYFNNLRQKKLEFTYDYKKFILEKRKTAYAEIEEIIDAFDTNLQNVFMYKDPQSEMAKTEFKNVYENVSRVSTMWCSTALRRYIDDFQAAYVFLTQLSDYPTDTQARKEYRHKFNECKKTYFKIIDAYFDDIMHLDDIEKFKKEKLVYYQKLLAD